MILIKGKSTCYEELLDSPFMMGVGLAFEGMMTHDVFDTDIVSIAISPLSEFPRTPSNMICVVFKQIRPKCDLLETL
jgi:hypothetical protein